MNYFVIGYYTLLIGASCLAAYYQARTAFLLLFSLTLGSFIMGIIGGEPALWFVTVSAGVIALAAGTSYAFREFLVIILPDEMSRNVKGAPLTASFGLFVVMTYAIAGLFAPVIAPFGEAEVISTAFAPADAQMLLGADQLGRDMFSRIIYGARNSVGLALLATAIAFFFGAVAGLIAATKGGWFDQAMGRVVDVVMSIPSIIFALLLLSIFGTSTTTLVIVIGVIYSPRVFRLSRAVAGNIVVMDYIEAAKLRGEGTWYLIRKEILPNSTAPLIAEFGLEFSFVFLLVAGLSFLGLGIQPPTADWGSMVRENATLVSFGEITPLIPAGAIALLTVAVNFIVDWMLYRSSGLKE
ncbi:MAG: ABC transporter permease [Candidatus Sedimenticola endophacoides]|uniref:ABC transporter permease n=1 Tax=Candidatus Sedimenticola endophacoides TaxID=2548426 RepID=A0A657Q213_9GAMM|nr:MAG: ABC transporter permease [Candidatus Sedimenticola endophacoides]OQX33809.1 MAG: ABC transporter permease [Candidatus Sedimenticola endophacoides]OQX34033.1 MAG: ABC transporter permease [Candidatus Sedimenticola endophacoides]OQX42251.1 MAG: ABC transporter permease [Candidatus Sedimenticola endophacoides]OQX48251.1 MAG: ABC transporter permease [Candidatus Sedimenticola endophacoides]